MKCEYCGSTTIVPIVYGSCDAIAFELADRGAIQLGGCISSGEEPLWSCRGCLRALPLSRASATPNEYDVYHCAVDAAFASYTPSSAHTREVERGLSALRAAAQVFRVPGTLAARIEAGSDRAALYVRRGTEWSELTYFPIDSVPPLRAAVAELTRLVAEKNIRGSAVMFRASVGPDERDFVVALNGPDGNETVFIRPPTAPDFENES